MSKGWELGTIYTGETSHIYLDRSRGITKSHPSTEVNDGLPTRV